MGLSGKEVLWVNGIREVPGLFLMFIAMLIARLPLSRRAVLALLFMGVGYGLYALANSYVALIAVVLLASVGFHNWGPLNSSLALNLTTKETSGRALGSLAAVGSLAAIVGMGLIALLSTATSLRVLIGAGGALIVLGAILVSRLPSHIGHTTAAQPKLLLKRRYWLYYVLVFFEGCRTQIFGSLGTWVLVKHFELGAGQIGLLLLGSSVVNLLGTPYLGRALDRFGERSVLAVGYTIMAFCFVLYATVPNVWALAGALLVLNLLFTLHMGLATYVHRTAPAEELTPTLTAGVSFNHISSVAVSLVGGALLEVVGYQALCWGIAALVGISVPFALALRVRR
jgi:predicted MFS family arabinose efflux permease